MCISKPHACARLAGIAAVMLVLLIPGAPASARSGSLPQSAVQSSPMGIVIRFKPNFTFTDDLVRDANGGLHGAEDYGQGSKQTALNLFPFFIILLVVIGVVALLVQELNKK